MPLKPLDLIVCLELAPGGGPYPSYEAIAEAVGLSASEANRAAQRGVEAGLLLPAANRCEKPRPNVRTLLEFLEHGVRYAFYVQPGRVVRGIPTAHSAPPLSGQVPDAGELPLVWPDPEGELRGQAVEPLYRTAPATRRKNERLYEMLTLVDALRCGRARERELAIAELKRRIAGEAER